MRKRKHKKLKGQCYFGNCKKVATYGFISNDKNIQPEKYCKDHIHIIKNNKVFPNCKLIQLPKKLIHLPNIIDCIDMISEEKKKEAMKELLK